MPELSIAPPRDNQDYVDDERITARAVVRRLIAEGRPGFAFYKLARSVERQNRLAGNGTIHIPACPCGGRCCRGRGAR